MNLFGGPSLWGVDIGSGSIKAVRVRASRRGIQLLNAAIYEFPEEGALSEGLRALFGPSLGQVHSAVQYSGKNPPVVRYLSVPLMPAKELTEAVRWEARKVISFPIEDAVVDFLVMGKSEDGEAQHFQILMVIVEKAALLGQVRILKEAGLAVEAVDVAPLALLNTLRLAPFGQFPGSLLYVDIGAQKMEINILKGGVLHFNRQLAMGGDEITRALSQSLGVPFSEAEQRKRDEGMAEGSALRATIQGAVDRFIVEIQRSIDYYRAQSREPGIGKIALMGGTPLMAGFVQYFSGFFDAPVELLDPFAAMISQDPGLVMVRRMAPRFSLAAGLALRKQ